MTTWGMVDGPKYREKLEELRQELQAKGDDLSMLIYKRLDPNPSGRPTCREAHAEYDRIRREQQL